MIAMNIPTDRILVPAALAGAAVVLLVLERVFPLRRRTRPTAGRAATNVIISALGLVAGALAVRPVATGLIDWSSASRFGLLRVLPVPEWARCVLGVVLMDVTFYYWHRANHQFGLLWRFHAVHHVDPDMDVTTSFRFHPGEILYSVAFRAGQVVLLGVSLRTYVLYETAFQAITLFHHSNLRLPIGLERALNRLFVTPRMHGVHHSVRRQEVNSNYSVIFRVWDRLHRTLMLDVPQAEITIGVAGRRSAGDNAIGRLLLGPFRRKVQGPDAGADDRQPARATGSRVRMAE